MIIGLSGKKQHGKDTVGLIIQYLIYNRVYTGGNSVNILYAIENPLADTRILESISGWNRKSFAYKLKQIVCILIGCTMEELESGTFKETPLGDDFKQFFVAHYKISNNNNPNGRVSIICSTREEAIALQEKIRVDTGMNGTHIVSHNPTPRELLQLIGTQVGKNMIHPYVWVNSALAGYNKDNHNWIFTDVRFKEESGIILNKGGMLIRVNRPDKISTDTHESETSLDDYDKFTYTITNDGTLQQLIDKVEQILINASIIR